MAEVLPEQGEAIFPGEGPVLPFHNTDAYMARFNPDGDRLQRIPAGLGPDPGYVAMAFQQVTGGGELKDYAQLVDPRLPGISLSSAVTDRAIPLLVARVASHAETGRIRRSVEELSEFFETEDRTVALQRAHRVGTYLGDAGLWVIVTNTNNFRESLNRELGLTYIAPIVGLVLKLDEEETGIIADAIVCSTGSGNPKRVARGRVGVHLYTQVQDSCEEK